VITSGADQWKVTVNGTDMTSNYRLEPVLKGNLIIDQASATIPLSIVPHSVSHAYNGQAQTVTVTDGEITLDDTPYANRAALLAARNIALFFTATATGTIPGVYETVVNPSGVVVMMGGTDVTPSYDVTLQTGVFEITPRGIDLEDPEFAIVISLPSGAVDYAGRIQTYVTSMATQIAVDGVDIGVLNAQNGSTLTVEFSAAASGMLPGSYPLVIANLSDVVVKLDGIAVTENYSVSQVPGQLTINPLVDAGKKIPIVITPANVEKDFNGKRQSSGLVTDGTVTVGGQLLNVFNQAGEPALEVAFAAEGSGLKPGDYDILINGGSVTIMQDGVDVSDNFAVAGEKGVFTISALTGVDRIALSIRPEDMAETYTGYEISIPPDHGATVLHGGEPIANYPEVTVTFTMTGKGTAPGTYAIEVDSGSVSVMAGGVSVLTNYEVVLNTNDLIIRPRTAIDGNLLPLTIHPEDVEMDFTGLELTATVTNEGTVTIDGKPISDFPSLTVTFDAEGKGTYVGAYPIVVNPATVKVMAGTVDVTSNYDPAYMAGSFKIKQSTIPITIGVDDPTPLVYNALNQGYPQFDGIEITNRLPAGAMITINKAVSARNAGSYPIAFTAADVAITLGTMNVTPNYQITCMPGTMVIEKKKLIGTLTADDPTGGPFTYGDNVNVTKAEYNFPMQPDGFVYGFEGDDELPYAVDRAPNTLDAYDASMAQIMYAFIPRLTPSAHDQNYDTAGLVMMPSDDGFTLSRAMLTIRPADAEMLHAQHDPLPHDFRVVGDGYKHSDTMGSVGLTGVIYGTSMVPSDAIGTVRDITYVSGPTTLQNYDVTYTSMPNGFRIYGWVDYHANYPTGNDVIARDRKRYLSPDEMVDTPLPQDFGFMRENLWFDGWTLDAAGTKPYTPDAIGEQSFALYAHWLQTYKLTIKHQNNAGDMLAADQIVWHRDGALVAVAALDLEGYEPNHIEYVSQGVTYHQSIGADYDVVIMMPKGEVNAVIHYTEGPGTTSPPAGGGADDGQPGNGKSTRRTAGTATRRDYSSIPAYPLPTDGTSMSATKGLCID